MTVSFWARNSFHSCYYLLCLVRPIGPGSWTWHCSPHPLQSYFSDETLITFGKLCLSGSIMLTWFSPVYNHLTSEWRPCSLGSWKSLPLDAPQYPICESSAILIMAEMISRRQSSYGTTWTSWWSYMAWHASVALNKDVLCGKWIYVELA